MANHRETFLSDCIFIPKNFFFILRRQHSHTISVTYISHVPRELYRFKYGQTTKITLCGPPRRSKYWFIIHCISVFFHGRQRWVVSRSSGFPNLNLYILKRYARVDCTVIIWFLWWLILIIALSIYNVMRFEHLGPLDEF